jgi:hypothetical protein
MMFFCGRKYVVRRKIKREQTQDSGKPHPGKGIKAIEQVWMFSLFSHTDRYAVHIRL